MAELFAIDSDHFLLSWSSRRDAEPSTLPGTHAPPGRLVVQSGPGRSGISTRRTGVPEAVAADPSEIVGPRLFEQTDYAIYLQSKSTNPVTLATRDPVLLAGLSQSEKGRVVHGPINFGSQVGRTEFEVRTGGRTEAIFEVEVFPTKLDYATDYEQL